jgi:carboxyl-terminal processing protease
MLPRVWIVGSCLVLLAACAAPGPAPQVPPSATVIIVPIATVQPATTPSPVPTMAPEAAAYLETALDVMEENSLNRLQLDWGELRATAMRLAGGAQAPANTYSAIRYVLRKAGGVHSFFLTPKQAAAWGSHTVDDVAPPRASLLLDQVGYIAIGGVLILDVEAANEYATRVQQLIREVDAGSPCGWIVDLRENTGGNMYPMLAGLGPILGEGVAGQFLDPAGHTTQWSYQAGQAFSAGEAVTSVIGPAYHLEFENPPVSVLTGPNTASSGEAMVISFRGRPNTRSFGLSTTGLSTANAGYPMSDGAMIFVTTSVMADRTGEVYGGYINPDEVVSDERQSTIIEGESIPQPAIDWLLAQPVCAE